MFDNLFFIILPYGVVLLAVVVTVQRYVKRPFTYSSLSSQFLESGELFYGSVSWHIGILAIFIGHVLGLLFPRQVLWFNAVPARLYLLESSALLFGFMALAGLVNLLIRRQTSARIRAVTSKMDILVLLLLLTQVGLGVYVAIFYRWGSSWYATSLVPYLRSLFTLQPDLATIAPLPLGIKLHVLNAWLLLAVFPFSRLVHMLVAPIHYLWRPYQLVVWNWNRKKIRGGAVRPASRGVDAPVGVSGELKPTSRPLITR